MNILRKIFTKAISPKLIDEAKKSNALLQQIKEENVFHSKTITELLSDKFRYKGYKPNTILIKDLKTGEPVEAQVKISREQEKNVSAWVKERYSIVDKFDRLIGEKTFTVETRSNGSYKMLPGDMETFRHEYAGVGFRLDQMQIERALELGITSIPRDALPQATLYHTKMGFLPVEKKLVRVNSQNDIPKLIKNEFENKLFSPPIDSFTPIIVEKNGKFYIDVNKTKLVTNLNNCKETIEKTHAHRILHIMGKQTNLVLSGKELEHWKELLKGHEILPTLDCAR